VLERATDWVIRLNDPSASVADFLAWQIWLAESPDHSRVFADVQESWRRAGSISQATDINAKEIPGSRSTERARSTHHQ
jgi:ferric-dicitrate binding protein FerR (iron transport regulator)